MTLPNFLLIGAAKSGTSAVYSFLAQHPEIYMSPNKEPNFFALEGLTVDFQGPGDESINHRSVTTLPDYEGLFAVTDHQRAIGEASTLYLYDKTAPARISHYLPDMKLIAILRDPVERAYSSFRHLQRDGREPATTFAQALDDEPRRIAAGWSHIWHYQTAGFYGQQLQRYASFSGTQRLLILVYRDFVTDPAAFMQRIFQFLDVDDTFRADTSKRFNQSGRPRSQRFQKWLVQPGRLKDLSRPLVSGKLRNKVLSHLMQLNVVAAKSEILPADRERLCALFRDDILKLQTMVDADLTPWLESNS